jgi:hypothetical protein
MHVSRALAALAMLAPLLAGAGCSSAGAPPCAYCDAGKADLPADLGQDYPAPEDVPSAETAGETEAATTPDSAEGVDGGRPATRDAPAGEAAQPSRVPDAGYVLDDDFETGQAPGWHFLGEQDGGVRAGDWSVILGDTGSVLSQGALDADAWHIAYATPAIGPDQILEAKLRVIDFYAEAASDMAALFGRYDPATDSGYLVALRGDGSMIVRKREHGASASWGGGVDVGIRSGVWYTVRLEVIGGTINAFLDGVSVYRVVDDAPLATGGVALGTFGATLEVESIFAAEP